MLEVLTEMDRRHVMVDVRAMHAVISAVAALGHGEAAKALSNAVSVEHTTNTESWRRRARERRVAGGEPRGSREPAHDESRQPHRVAALVRDERNVERDFEPTHQQSVREQQCRRQLGARRTGPAALAGRRIHDGAMTSATCVN